ncbi:hypothetical protein FN846DRAFT_969081 [Sphaerosporella brunnea]|uniref:Uncharacterized protein n=1 Tax=Sphaerosporella brunnea TaxID=1250544 RepID=A0A5J5EK27_9PEZI|nr:hypothetical protein FN846DRAFT_969081 [Sphaerosporella brunnea]
MAGSTESSERGPGETRPSPTEAGPSGPQYVDLGKDFSKDLDWTNDPSDLYLDTYFDPAKPNLGKDFQIVGLKPVIKQKEGETFLLQDGNGRFYVWNEYEGGMYRFEKALKVQDAVNEVLEGVQLNSVDIARIYTPDRRQG